MPDQSVHYLVEAVHPQAHLFRVSLEIPEPDVAGETVSLPAWIPGSYMIREFSKNLVEIHARQGEDDVSLHKLDKHTWRSGKLKPGQTLVIQTLVYAWDLSVRCAHLDESHGFFNGTQMFLCVAGRASQAHTVTLHRPAGASYAQWRLATNLRPFNRRSVDRDGFGKRHAADYDELIDHPVEMGTFSSVKFEACGVPHEMILTGKMSFDAKRLAHDLKIVCETQINLFGHPPPFERYLFMTMVVGDGYGGLEHRSSTALLCSRKDLPAPGSGRSEAYRQFLGLCSHEYFHAWNVKRIKPAVFYPYSLDRENYTSLLWVFEGFTSYYDDLALVRSGLISQDEYLAVLGKTVGAVERNAGRLRQSVAESSFDAWTKYYRQDENSPNAIVSYYQKGALVALGLDLTIRAKTHHRYSLDDVMRYLWVNHGEGSGGVEEGAMPLIIKAATGVDVRKEIASWVTGCEDVPLARLLKPFGLELNRRAGPRSTGLGVRLRPEGGVLRLANVLDGGSGQSAGLSAGDELIAVDGLRATPGNLEGVLERILPGSRVEVLVFRRDELLRYMPEYREPSLEECDLKPMVKPTEPQLRHRALWLGK